MIYRRRLIPSRLRRTEDVYNLPVTYGMFRQAVEKINAAIMKLAQQDAQIASAVAQDIKALTRMMQTNQMNYVEWAQRVVEALEKASVAIQVKKQQQTLYFPSKRSRSSKRKSTVYFPSKTTTTTPTPTPTTTTKTTKKTSTTLYRSLMF